MRRRIYEDELRVPRIFLGILLIVFIGLVIISCSKVMDPNTIIENEEKGCIKLEFSKNKYHKTKTFRELPDTNNFFLEITSKDNSSIYSGKYGDAPGSFKVPAGEYKVGVYSSVFKKPAFSKPVYGDEQVIIVKPEKSVKSVLDCRMINGCIKLVIPKEFLTAYPESVLFLKSKDGKLMYSYREKRFAYFKPGKVSIILFSPEKERIIGTKNLKAREALTIGLNISKASSEINAVDISSKDCIDEIEGSGSDAGSDADSDSDSDLGPTSPSDSGDENSDNENSEDGATEINEIIINIDTSAVYKYSTINLKNGNSDSCDDSSDGINWGDDDSDCDNDSGGNSGSGNNKPSKDPTEGFTKKDLENAFNIAQARANIGSEDVWVRGYIVGGDLTSSRINFDPPFKSMTNFAIGPNKNTRDKIDCLSVQLPKGKIRDLLNLVENPKNLGCKVYLKGNIVASYYGRIGIKNIKKLKIIN